jgi:hypothetical protein
VKRTNTANLETATGKSTEGRLGTRAGGLGTGTTGSTELNVKSGDSDLLATSSNIDGGKHGSVGGRLVTVSLNLHTTYTTQTTAFSKDSPL